MPTPFEVAIECLAGNEMPCPPSKQKSSECDKELACTACWREYCEKKAREEE
jgi:hypothetical protein